MIILGRLITRAKENEGELQSVLETGIADAIIIE